MSAIFGICHLNDKPIGDDIVQSMANVLSLHEPKGKAVLSTPVRLNREQIQLVGDGGAVGTGVAARKGLLQGHLLEKRDRQMEPTSHRQVRPA